jgi:hypothetical protein
LECPKSGVWVNLQKQKVKSEIETKIVKMIQEKKKLFTFVKTRQGTEIVPIENCDQELVEEFLKP